MAKNPIPIEKRIHTGACLDKCIVELIIAYHDRDRQRLDEILDDPEQLSAAYGLAPLDVAFGLLRALAETLPPENIARVREIVMLEMQISPRHRAGGPA